MRVFKIIYFLVSLGLTIALVRFLQSPIAIKDKSLPPLGNFFNPFSGFWRNADQTAAVPGKTANISLPALKAEAQVVYDDQMVPHIFAQNAEDASMLQGYVTAQQRLWQMDMSARSASGRLSEVLGARTVEVDRLSRRQGMVFAAENTLKGWRKSPDGMLLVEAYTKGVNAYIESLTPANYPIEFKLLNYAPEPWTELKTALVIEAMAKTLSTREDDLASTNSLALLGQPTFDFLFPEWNPKQKPVIEDKGQWSGIKNATMAAPKTLPVGANKMGYSDDLQPNPLSGLPEANQSPYSIRDARPLNGSNNWAIDSSKSASKAPLLANDPHLSLTLPSIWFQVQIHTPESNCYGVSLPGFPGIIIGFNDNIAWGVTNVGHDVVDWYQIKWADEKRSSYMVDGQTNPVDFRIEAINIKDQPTLMDTVRYTKWGPVTHDYKPGHPLADCAMRWLTHDEPTENVVKLFNLLNKGKTYADYQKAISGFDCPAQNIALATRNGDIAITVQGKLPLRANQQGRFILDGSSSSNAWHGFIPESDIPREKNPAKGFVFSANQHSAPPTYPYYFLGDFEDYRSRRIYARLDSMKNATVDSMKALQLDMYSTRAADALPVMLKLLTRSGLDANAQKLLSTLEKWNCHYDKDLDAPTLFESWIDSTYLQTWDELTVKKTDNNPLLLPEYWRFIDLMTKDTANIFFDHPNTPARETAREIVTEGFKLMLKKYGGSTPMDMSWGKAKGFYIKHLGNIESFGRYDVLVGGHKSAPNAILNNFGPSWRMIVELGNPVKAIGIFPGGQSGNPGSPFYDNMVEPWAKGEYNTLQLLRKPEELTTSLLKQTFKPASK